MAKKRGRTKAVKPSPTIKVEADVPSKDKDEDVVSTPIATSSQPVLKICRLCETKDGPFLNIFEYDTIILRKIKDLMPFTISENDTLPHKICFRCSAKVEEFHEFVQKCVKSQENLTKLYSKTEAPPTKTKARQLWEEKLNESKMSNDDICDALIKMAMEGLKDAPLKPQNQKPSQPQVLTNVSSAKHADPDNNEIEDIPLKQIKQSLGKSESRNMAKRSRTRGTDLSDSSIESPSSSKAKVSQAKEDKSKLCSTETDKKPQNADDSINNLSFDYDDKPSHKKAKPTPKLPEKEQPKPFNIKEHVSMIKVNGVGVLFQCKLCNRNFLKKDIVATHGCAKNGVPKEDFTSNIPPPPEPPKPSVVVKYINTKIDEIKKPVPSPAPAVSAPPPVKPKPRIGPASKVKKDVDTEPAIGMVVTPTETGGEKSTVLPTVSFPNLPNLKNSYKLVPGPNNTFTLVEETSKSAGVSITKNVGPAQAIKRNQDQTITPAVINLDDSPPSSTQSSQPYPVGLFQTLPHHSEAPVPIPTLASKKQSYTIVQTGNPSKLLISTKPQPPAPEPETVQKKRPRKSKIEIREEAYSEQSLNVAVEDKAGNKSDYFTFVNLDPLLQPSYVLPTSSIVQESQISTSTPLNPVNAKKDDTSTMYSCNMCSESFSREKKLLAHIQSHFNSMDEEDRKRNDVNTRKRTRK